jgi:hypothetical protein
MSSVLHSNNRSDGLTSKGPLRGVLVVQVRCAGEEDKPKRILRACGAEAIRVHEIEIKKRRDDVPLSSLHVDPWLGEHGYLGDF